MATKKKIIDKIYVHYHNSPRQLFDMMPCVDVRNKGTAQYELYCREHIYDFAWIEIECGDI